MKQNKKFFENLNFSFATDYKKFWKVVKQLFNGKKEGLVMKLCCWKMLKF